MFIDFLHRWAVYRCFKSQQQQVQPFLQLRGLTCWEQHSKPIDPIVWKREQLPKETSGWKASPVQNNCVFLYVHPGKTLWNKLDDPFPFVLGYLAISYNVYPTISRVEFRFFFNHISNLFAAFYPCCRLTPRLHTKKGGLWKKTRIPSIKMATRKPMELHFR